MKLTQMLSRLDPKWLEKALDDWFDPRGETEMVQKSQASARCDGVPQEGIKVEREV